MKNYEVPKPSFWKKIVQSILSIVAGISLASMLLLFVLGYGKDIAIGIAPIVIFLGFWLPQSWRQSKEHEKNLKISLDEKLAEDFADVEFKNSFFLEVIVIQIIYEMIFGIQFGNISVEWVLLGFMMSLIIPGLIFVHYGHKSLVPIVAIPICSIMLGEVGYILGKNPTDVIGLMIYSLIGFICVDSVYLIWRHLPNSFSKIR